MFSFQRSRGSRLSLTAAVAGLGMFAGAASADTAYVFDFDTDANGNPIAAGQVIDDEYASAGLLISAMHPSNASLDYAIAQDSGSGYEMDHITPGPGPNNDTAYNNVLIVPLTADGPPDAPPDRPGGKFFFTFTDTHQTSGSVTILDAEEPEAGDIMAYLGGNLVGTYDILGLGDNSIQTIGINTSFDLLQVNLGGSGAVVQVSATAAPTPSAALAGLALLGGLVMRRRSTQA